MQPAETISDLYGFPIKVYASQDKERKDCDAAEAAATLAWAPYIETQKLPASEAKVKEMIRKVRRRGQGARACGPRARTAAACGKPRTWWWWATRLEARASRGKAVAVTAVCQGLGAAADPGRPV